MSNISETSSQAPDAPGSVSIPTPYLGQQVDYQKVQIAPYGGPFEAIPGQSTLGTLLPPGPNGVRIHLGSSGTFTYTKAALQPTVAPTMLETLTGSVSAPRVEIYVNSFFAGIYVTAFSAGVFYEPI